ncbi:aconitase family protein [Paraphotobacterium marinum]|nr:aconitase family protein [Paraphotobacterium marinum]
MKLNLNNKVLYLTKDKASLYSQLNGEAYTLKNISDLRDNISTDEISPVPIMYNFDERLKDYPHTGLKVEGDLPIKFGEIAKQKFSVIVAGKRYGKGSSREHSPVAEFHAGVRLIIAESFEYIYRQNADNIGLYTSTDFSLLNKIKNNEPIDLEDILKDRDTLTKKILTSKGLLGLGKKVYKGDDNRLHHKPEVELPNTPMTFAEKILYRHHEFQPNSPYPLKSGLGGFIKADWRFIHEAYTGMAMSMLHKEYPELTTLYNPEKIIAFEEHFGYRHRSKYHIEHNLIESFDTLSGAHTQFSKKYNIRSHGQLSNEDGSEGISHSLMAEKYALPGEVVVGTDSHTTHSGALGCLAFGVGTTNLANALVTGVVRYNIPDVVKIEVKGKLASHVSSKDLALSILKEPKIKNGNFVGKIIEFCGEVIRSMSIDERTTLTNMALEMGGFCGIVAPDTKTIDFIKERRNYNFQLEDWMKADAGAKYSDSLIIDASTIDSMLSSPGDPSNGIAFNSLEHEVKIDIAYGGSCTAGKRSDFDQYLEVLIWAQEKKLNIHESIKFFLQVGSLDVKKYCDQKGYLKILKEMNIELLNPQCGACCNCGPGSSTKKEEVTISSINRNFPGRSGPGSVWLASPKTVVASAIAGKITSFEKLKQMYVE